MHTVLIALFSAFSLLSSSNGASFPVCAADSSPNPIAAVYPNIPTGTLNETVAVLPIDYALARSLVPHKWTILKGYKKLLPDFPAWKYPLVLEFGVDHDIEYGGMNVVADFSSVRITFPFIDLLGDGRSNFRYTPTIFLSPIPIAVEGAEAYGEYVIQSLFEPQCDAFAKTPRAKDDGYYFRAHAIDGPSSFKATFAPLKKKHEAVYPFTFYRDVFKQPTFGNGSSCDNFTHVYSPEIFKPVNVEGSVAIKAPPFAKETAFRDVQGVQLDSAFIETNYLDCSVFKGWSVS